MTVKFAAICLSVFFLAPFLRAEPIYTPAYDVDEALAVPSARDTAIDLLWDLWRHLPKAKRGPTGLVLSGGGARGMAHIGILRHLEEIGFPIDSMAATSMGALVGGVYAAGVGIEKIEKMAQEIGFSRMSRFTKTKFLTLALKDGGAPTELYQRWLSAAIDKKTFAETKFPLAICATDLVTGELILLKEGPLAPALLAAATIPGLFRPVSIRQHFLVDGGLLYNIPTEMVAILGAKNVLVVDVSARSYDQPMTRPPSSLRALYRSIEIMGNRMESTTYNGGDYVLRFFPSGVEMFELWRWKEIWEMGLREARSHSQQLRLAFITKAIETLGPEFFALEQTALK
ncbi:MAG: patatin-like phospholipase family protein [Elusimicrobia bacterium]|nr:patatin-like phospholipase family protein [Elusimicrobiota bacterium]